MTLRSRAPRWAKLTLLDGKGPIIVKLSAVQAMYGEHGHGVLEMQCGTYPVDEDVEELCELICGFSTREPEEHN